MSIAEILEKSYHFVCAFGKLSVFHKLFYLNFSRVQAENGNFTLTFINLKKSSENDHNKISPWDFAKHVQCDTIFSGFFWNKFVLQKKKWSIQQDIFFFTRNIYLQSK